MMNTVEVHVIKMPVDDSDTFKSLDALIVKMSDKNVYLLTLTERNTDDSISCYSLKQWKEAGIKTRSSVDLKRQYKLDKNIVKQSKLIGKLTMLDTLGLVEGLKKEIGNVKQDFSTNMNCHYFNSIINPKAIKN